MVILGLLKILSQYPVSIVEGESETVQTMDLEKWKLGKTGMLFGCDKLLTCVVKYAVLVLLTPVKTGKENDDILFGAFQ